MKRETPYIYCCRALGFCFSSRRRSVEARKQKKKQQQWWRKLVKEEKKRSSLANIPLISTNACMAGTSRNLISLVGASKLFRSGFKSK